MRVYSEDDLITLGDGKHGELRRITLKVLEIARNAALEHRGERLRCCEVDLEFNQNMIIRIIASSDGMNQEEREKRPRSPNETGVDLRSLPEVLCVCAGSNELNFGHFGNPLVTRVLAAGRESQEHTGESQAKRASLTKQSESQSGYHTTKFSPL